MFTMLYCFDVDKFATQNIVERKGDMMEGTQILERYYQESGKTKQYLCHKLMVSRPRLDKIFKEPASATVGQASALKSELNIRSIKDFDSIFLPKE